MPGTAGCPFCKKTQIKTDRRVVNMKHMLIAQSGGPSAAINATVAGVVERCMTSDKVDRIYGAVNGIKGVLNGNYVDLSQILFLARAAAAAVQHTGGSFGLLPLKAQQRRRRAAGTDCRCAAVAGDWVLCLHRRQRFDGHRLPAVRPTSKSTTSRDCR